MAPTPTTPFPLYLLPRIPFRRRRSSTQSTSTISSSPSSSPPAPSFLTATPTTHLRCTKCLADLIPTSCIISKGFTGRHGRAYLVAPPPASALLSPPTSSTSATSSSSSHWRPTELPNTLVHRPVARQLVTGAHTVSDISCRACGTVLGWKYVHAEEETQRYKVGKYILETRRVVKSGGAWEDGDGDGYADGDDDGYADGRVNTDVGVDEGGDEDVEEVQFDSQDEDECEDLFSGVWSAELARRRRKGKEFGRR